MERVVGQPRSTEARVVEGIRSHLYAFGGTFNAGPCSTEPLGRFANMPYPPRSTLTPLPCMSHATFARGSANGLRFGSTPGGAWPRAAYRTPFSCVLSGGSVKAPLKGRTALGSNQFPRPFCSALLVQYPSADAVFQGQVRPDLPAVLREGVQVPHSKTGVPCSRALDDLGRPPHQQVTELAACASGSPWREEEIAVLVVVSVLLPLKAIEAHAELQEVGAHTLVSLSANSSSSLCA